MKAVTIAREILIQEIKSVVGKVKAKYKVIENIKNTKGNMSKERTVNIIKEYWN